MAASFSTSRWKRSTAAGSAASARDITSTTTARPSGAVAW